MTDKTDKYKFVNVPIADKETVTRLENRAKELQVSRAGVVRIALLEYLAKYNGAKNETKVTTG